MYSQSRSAVLQRQRFDIFFKKQKGNICAFLHFKPCIRCLSCSFFVFFCGVLKLLRFKKSLLPDKAGDEPTGGRLQEGSQVGVDEVGGQRHLPRLQGRVHVGSQLGFHLAQHPTAV